MDTTNNADIEIVKYKGFPSLYDKVNEDRWETKNEGFDYSETLIEKNTSRYMKKNPTMRSMFPYLNRMLAHMINSVKYLRNFNNFAVRKDYKRID